MDPVGIAALIGWVLLAGTLVLWHRHARRLRAGWITQVEGLRNDAQRARIERDAALNAESRANGALIQLGTEKALLEAETRGLRDDAEARDRADQAAATQRVADRQRELLAAAQRASDLEQFDAYLEEIIRKVCRDVGLNDAAFSRDLDLVATGKLHEVLHHTATALTTAQPVRTVGDVMRVLGGPARG